MNEQWRWPVQNPFAESIQPAIHLAEKGFSLDHLYATRLAGSADRLAQFPVVEPSCSNPMVNPGLRVIP